MKNQTQQAAPMIAFARLTKIDEEKRLVYGRAAQELPDRAKEKMDYDGSKPYFEAWSKSQLEASMGKSAGNIRGMHGKVAAGIVIPEGGMIFNDAEKAVDIVTHVVDDAEWKKVEAGAYTGFSIGGSYISKSAPDPKTGVVTYIGSINEISLVDRPALPTATFFEVQKADGTVAKQEFAKPVMRKMVRRDGAALNMEVDDRDLPKPGEEFQAGDQRYLLAKVENGNAYVDEVYDLVGSPAELATFAKLMTERGLTISGATLLLEKSAPAVVKEPADADVLAKAAQIAHDLDKADFKKLAETDAKRAEYIAKAKEELKKVTAPAAEQPLAKVFADEAGKRFPLDTVPQVKAAWAYAHIAKGYDDAARATLLGNITKAAKAKSIELQPAAEMTKMLGASIDSLMKSLYEPADAELVAAVKEVEKVDSVSLEKIVDDKERAKKLEEMSIKAVDALYTKLSDEARGTLRKRAWEEFLRKSLWQCADFAQLLQSLCNLAESVEYEAAMEGDGSELFMRLNFACAELGTILADMVTEEVGEATGVVTSSGVLMAMAKSVGTRLEKAKETHKAVALKHIQKAHDNSVKMGAKCASDAAALAAAAGGDLSKADSGVLSKALQESAAALAKANETIGAMDERLKKIEAQPMPARVSIRAIAKEDDTGTDAAGLAKAAQLAGSIQPVRKADGSVDEVATAVKMMRSTGGVQVMEKS